MWIVFNAFLVPVLLPQRRQVKRNHAQKLRKARNQNIRKVPMKKLNKNPNYKSIKILMTTDSMINDQKRLLPRKSQNLLINMTIELKLNQILEQSHLKLTKGSPDQCPKIKNQDKKLNMNRIELNKSRPKHRRSQNLNWKVCKMDLIDSW